MGKELSVDVNVNPIIDDKRIKEELGKNLKKTIEHTTDEFSNLNKQVQVTIRTTDKFIETVQKIKKLDAKTGKWKLSEIVTRDTGPIDRMRAKQEADEKRLNDKILAEQQRAEKRKTEQEKKAMQARIKIVQDGMAKMIALESKVGSIAVSASKSGVSTAGLTTAMSDYRTAFTGAKPTDVASVERAVTAQKALSAAMSQTQAQTAHARSMNVAAQSTANLTRQIQSYVSIHGSIRKGNQDLYNSFNALISCVQKGTIPLDEAKRQFAELRMQTRELGKENKTFGQSVKEAFGRYAAIGGATTMLLYIRRVIKEIISAVKELDKAIVNIQVVTGYTYEQADKLLKTYSELGRQLGATTGQIASAANDWLRQGFTIEQANQLIESSTMLSKLGMLSAEEATSYLTSAMRGYKVEVEDVVGIVDKLTAVDMEAAISAGGIAEAMSLTANSARITGVSMEKLIGIMAAVGEVTQDVSKTGTAFKTMFARMSNVKLGKFEDEDGNNIKEELNDLERVLNRINIPLRKNATEWNNFGDVLDQLASKWSTLSGVEQSAIATALGGVRQKEAILTMLENYDKVLQYEQVAFESAGTAVEKFENAYVNSIEAKTNAMKASFEMTARGLVDSGIIKGLLDIGNAFLHFLGSGNTFIKTLGVAGTALILFKNQAIATGLQQKVLFGTTLRWAGATKAGSLSVAQLSAATITMNNAETMSVLIKNKATLATAQQVLAEKGLTKAEAEAILVKYGYMATAGKQAVTNLGLTGSFYGLATSVWASVKAMLAFLATNPVGWVILAVAAIGGLVWWINRSNQAVEKAAEKATEANEKWQEVKDSIKSINSELETTSSRIAELKALGSLTLVEQEELQNLEKNNEKLKEQLMYEQELERIRDKEAKVAATELYDEMSKDVYGQEKFTWEFERPDIGFFSTPGQLPVDAYKSALDEYEELEKRKLGLSDKEEKRLKKLESGIAEYESTLLEHYKNFQTVYDAYGKDDPMGAQAYAQMQKIMGIVGGEEAKSKLFTQILSDFPKVNSHLTELSEKGELTQKDIDALASIFPKFSEAMKNASIPLTQLIAEFKNASNPVADLEESLKSLSNEMDLLPDRMMDLEEIQKKVNDGYHFSIKEIDEIRKKYPELEKAITRTAYGFQIQAGAIDTLSTGVRFTKQEIEVLKGKYKNLSYEVDETTGLYYLNADALKMIGTSAIQARADLIKFQIDTTKQSAEETKKRIELLISEGKALSTYDALVRMTNNPGYMTKSEWSSRKASGHPDASRFATYEDYAASKAIGDASRGVADLQAEYDSIMKSISSISSGSVSGYSPEKSKGKDVDTNKEAFEKQKAIYDRQLALNIITEREYTDKLEVLYKKHFSDKTKYLDEYTKYEIEVYKNRQKFLTDAQKAIDDIHKATIDLIKKEKEAEKDALKEKKDALKEFVDARKDALKQARDQDEYDKKLRERTTDVEKLQAQLMGLSGDTSASGMRKKLEIQEQLKKAQEALNETVSDRQHEMQIEAIDKAYEKQEETIDKQIDNIDEFLNDQSKLVQASFDRMNGMSATLKSQLIAYNKEYGDGIANDIVKNWDEATKALQRYGSVANIKGTQSNISSAIGRPPTGYASGTSGLKRDSIIVGTHELILNKDKNLYQQVNAGSPIFTKEQVVKLKNLLSSPTAMLNQRIGGGMGNFPSGIYSMVNSNNSPHIEIKNEFNIEGTDPVGIGNEVRKLMPKISDGTVRKLNKQLFSNGVKLKASTMV